MKYPISGKCVFCDANVVYDPDFSKGHFGLKGVNPVGFCEIKAQKINGKLYPKHYVLFHTDCYHKNTRGARKKV